MRMDRPRCFGRVRVGAAGQPEVVGVVRAGGERLLAVHDVFVAVPDRPGAQRGEVGAGLRLGVADREVDLPGQDPRQEEVLLLGAAVRQQGGRHGLQGDRGQRHVGAGRLVHEDLLLDRAEPAAAVLGREAEPEPAVAAQSRHEFAVRGAVPFAPQLGALRGGQEPVEVRAQAGPQRVLLLSQVDEQGVPPAAADSARRRPAAGPGRGSGRCAGAAGSRPRGPARRAGGGRCARPAAPRR